MKPTGLCQHAVRLTIADCELSASSSTDGATPWVRAYFASSLSSMLLSSCQESAGATRKRPVGCRPQFPIAAAHLPPWRLPHTAATSLWTAAHRPEPRLGRL
jgi:hypothetical protein